MKLNRRKLLAGLLTTPAVAAAGEMGKLPAGHETYEKGGWRIIDLYGENCFLRIEDDPIHLTKNVYGRWDKAAGETFTIGTSVTYSLLRENRDALQDAEYMVRAALSRSINNVKFNLRTDDGPYAVATPPGATIMMI